jgi:hypothetical protein
MASFTVPFVSSNPNSWGPPEIDESNPNAPGNIAKFAALPYSPFGRSDRLGRSADFTGASRGYSAGFRRRDLRKQFEEEDGEGEESFQLVDTTKAVTTKRFVNPASKRRQHSQRLRQINARRQQSAGGAAAPLVMDKMARGGGRGFGGRGGFGGGRGGRGGGRFGGRFGGRGRGGYQNRVDRAPSVAVQDSWSLKVICLYCIRECSNTPFYIAHASFFIALAGGNRPWQSYKKLGSFYRYPSSRRCAVVRLP